MTEDDFTLSLVCLAGAVVVAVGMLTSRYRTGYWLLDPRGPFLVIVYLNACGLVLDRLLFGQSDDRLFGLVESLVPRATTLMATGALGFLLGTWLPTGPLRYRIPPMRLSEKQADHLSSLLMVGTVGTGAFNYLSLALQGLDTLLHAAYGSTQGIPDSVQQSAFFNIAFIAVPSLVMLLIHHAMLGRSMWTPRTLGLIVYTTLPALLSGGRKDLVLVVAAMGIATVLKQRRVRWAQIAAMGVGVLMLSYFISASRSGETLDLDERLTKVQEAVEVDNPVVTVARHGLTMYAGTPVMTAAMTLYPDDVPYTWGRSYFESAVNTIVPHFLTNTYMYVPQAQHFRELYYPTVHGFGLDYSMAAESFQNFGEVGPFLVFGVLGYLLTLTFDLARSREHPRNLWLLVHLQFLTGAMWGIRTDSNGLFKIVVYGGLWVALLGAAAHVWLVVAKPKTFVTTSRASPRVAPEGAEATTPGP